MMRRWPEYAAAATVVVCRALGVVQVMRRIGSALDKATAESFNSTVTSDPGDYALDLAGIGLGVFVAWTLIDWPAALTIIFGISLVLHGEVLVRQFREAARTDPETGLLKLPSWTNAAQQRIARVDDSGRPTVHLSDTTVS